MAATAPVWKANGTAASGISTVPVVWPSHAAGDFAILLVNTSNQAIATPSGWTLIDTNTGTGTAAAADSCMLQMFYRFATSGAEANVTLADSGDHTMGVIVTFTGVSTVNPVEAISAYTTKATNSLSDTFPTVTTLGANRLVIAAISTGQESVKSAPTFAGLTAFTARGVGITTSGLDGGVAMFSGGKAAAGATGTGSVTESITSKAISVTFALTPVDFEKTVTTTAIASQESFGALTPPAGVSRRGELSVLGIASAEAFGNAGVGFKRYVESTITINNYVGAGVGPRTLVTGLSASVAEGALHWLFWRDAKTSVTDQPYGIFAIPGAGVSNQPYIYGNQSMGLMGFTPNLTALTNLAFQSGTNNFRNTLDKNYTAYSIAGGTGTFSGRTYTGTGTGVVQTLSHDLGCVPGVMATGHDTASATAGSVFWYHKGVGKDSHVTHYDRSTMLTASAVWGNALPTATQVSVSGDANVAARVYYLVLFGDENPINDFIRSGTYTGNGSASGPTVTVGWKPRIINVFNNAGAAVDDDGTRMQRWVDTTNGAVGFSGNELAGSFGYDGAPPGPADTTADYVNGTSDGFQVVTTDNAFNRSGTTYYWTAYRSLDFTISASALASAEAFGAAVVTLGAAGDTVSPSSITTSEAFGSATLSPGAITVSPSAIASAEAIGSATVTPGAVTLSPSSIASGEAFGTAVLSPGAVSVTASAITSVEAIGSATVQPGAVTASPGSITSAEAIGDAIVTATASIAPAGISSGEAIGDATLSPGGVATSPNAIASDESFGTPAVQPGVVTVSPSSITSAEAFGSATVMLSATVEPSAIASAEGFGTPNLSAGAVTVSPSAIGSAEALGDATVSPGSVNVAPAGIASSEAFGTAMVSPGAVTVAPSGISSSEAFGTASVTPGVVSIAPSAIASAEAFGTAQVTSLATVAPAGVASSEAFGSATITSLATIEPAGIASAEAVSAPVLSSTVGLQPSGIASSEVFGSATLSTGPVAIEPSGIDTGEAFGTPTIEPGPVVLELVSIGSEEALGVPVIVVGGVVISLVGIASQEGFGAASLSTGGVTIEALSIESGEAFGDATFIPGVAVVEPTGIPGADGVGIPIVSFNVDETLFPTGIASLEAFGVASVARLLQSYKQARRAPNLTVAAAQTPVADVLGAQEPVLTLVAAQDPVSVLNAAREGVDTTLAEQMTSEVIIAEREP